MKKRILYLILPIITLILEILPYGAVCNFANPEGKPWRRTYSYFDLTPFGYANFAPLITAIITCIILVLLFIYLLTGKHRLVTAAKVSVVAAAIISLCPLLLGVSFFSVVGAFITSLLAIEAVLIFVADKTA